MITRLILGRRQIVTYNRDLQKLATFGNQCDLTDRFTFLWA
jgi:hypothetical protein